MNSSCQITCNSGLVRCEFACCPDCRLMSGACTGLDWCSDVNGQCRSVQKLLPDASATGGENFGNRVALSGTMAVIGAERDDGGVNVFNAGSAFTFERQADGVWRMQGSRLQPTTMADTYFGSAVSLSGQRLVVGARGNAGSNRGSFYVFERVAGAWVQQARVVTSVTAENFGYSASQDGDRVLIGATGASSSAGAAYIFERQSDMTWPTTGIKLVASNAAANAQFGVSLSISGDRALIGSATRAAYVFARQGDGTWTQEQILTTTQGMTGDQFGASVSLLGDRALVGAPDDNDRGNQAGAVYVFERQTTGGWTATTKLHGGPNSRAGDRFGFALSQEGDRVLIGARQYRTAAAGGALMGGGAAFIYQRNSDGTWTAGAEIATHPDDVFSGRNCGSDVSISGDFALMGCPSDYDGPLGISDRTGAAYVANWRSVLP
jgi:FG-GAP repeat protein